MSRASVHLELLLGKLVRDPEGARAGRIHSVFAEIDGDACLVREYGLGTVSLLECLGLPVRGEPLRVPWDLLDLGDPDHPRLRCTVAELKGRKG
jgi:hypothetical protein